MSYGQAVPLLRYNLLLWCFLSLKQIYMNQDHVIASLVMGEQLY